MVTPKTGRPRGRPKGDKKDFRTDPDRVAVAYAWLLIEGGHEESQAYTHAARFIAPLYTMHDEPKTGSVFFQIDNYRGLPDKPMRSIPDRLRKKGERWRDDPDATAHIEDLMNQVEVITESLESSESGDFLPRLWRELKAL
jgi:hypothetical protein